MDFHLKLQTLRKEKNLTQEELAKALFVSRTAISKWESGRGYPGIDSLKDIAHFFSVTIDDLLSGNEPITLAEQDNKQKKNSFLELIFGLVDLSSITLLFLPFFAQRKTGVISARNLLSLEGISPVLKGLSLAFIFGLIFLGIATLLFRNSNINFWQKSKRILSLSLTILTLSLFIISLQPYAAIYFFVFLQIKIFLLIKKI